MRLFTGSMMAAMLLTGVAHAQALRPPGEVAAVVRVSDVGEPYAPPYGAPRVYEELPPRIYDAPRYGYAPDMLGPREVYAIVRRAGFAPLGMLQQRGPVFTMAAVDPNGEDGRLVIDARSGQIVRFMPAYGLRDRGPAEVYVRDEPATPPPVLPQYRRAPYAAALAPAEPRVAAHPATAPAALAGSRYASRTPATPQPKRAVRAVAAPAKPVAADVAKPVAVAPPAAPAAAPTQQSAATTTPPAVEAKAPETTGAAPAAPKADAPPTVPAAPAEAKPAAPEASTNAPPAAQGAQ